jgi:predicted Zn finger-like uncharacterized protein
MILECNNCSTKFVISEEKIGEFGRKVKCSKCSNVWFATREDNVENKTLSRRYKMIEPEDIPSHSSVPAVINNSYNWLLAFLIPVMVLLIFISFTFTHPAYFSQWPGFSYIASSLGYSDTSGIEISEVKLTSASSDKTGKNKEKQQAAEESNNKQQTSQSEQQSNSHKAVAIIKIYNTNNASKTVPSLRVRVYDDKDQKLISKYLSPKTKTIESFSYMEVQSELGKLPKESKYIEVYLGSKLELTKI